MYDEFVGFLRAKKYFCYPQGNLKQWANGKFTDVVDAEKPRGKPGKPPFVVKKSWRHVQLPPKVAPSKKKQQQTCWTIYESNIIQSHWFSVLHLWLTYTSSLSRVRYLGIGISYWHIVGWSVAILLMKLSFPWRFQKFLGPSKILRHRRGHHSQFQFFFCLVVHPTNRVGGWSNPWWFQWDFCGGKSSTKISGVN